MRVRGVVAAVAAGLTVVLVAASPAAAKGADQVTITGPGLSAPIVVGGNGEPGSGTDLGQLADGCGLFDMAYSGSTGTVGTQPSGPLGAKYDLAFRFPSDKPEGDVFHMELYPAAPGGAVTYTPPGQHVYGGDSASGWHRTPADFWRVLAAVGIPGVASPAADPVRSSAAPAAAAPDQDGGTPWWAIAVAVVAALAAGTVAVLFLRRRSLTRPAQP